MYDTINFVFHRRPLYEVSYKLSCDSVTHVQQTVDYKSTHRALFNNLNNCYFIVFFFCVSVRDTLHHELLRNDKRF